MNKIKKLNTIEFIYIAKYIQQNEIVTVDVVPSIKKTERKSLVYILVDESDKENIVKYIGKTIQGYSRPLSYHKNNVMKDVKVGIEYSVGKGNDIDVYIFEPPLLTFKGLQLDIIESLEQALIKKHKPEWNNHIAK